MSYRLTGVQAEFVDGRLTVITHRTTTDIEDMGEATEGKYYIDTTWEYDTDKNVFVKAGAAVGGVRFFGRGASD